MIDNATLVFGPPGCGKTHFLLSKIRDALASGIHPSRIVFVGFTRKAIREAVDRACTEFNLTEKDLPFFRTLHSMAFRALGIGKGDMMGPDDYRTLGNDLGMDLSVKSTSFDDGTIIPSYDGNGARYLFLEARARYRGVSLEQEFNEAQDWDMHYPLLEKLHRALTSYKAATGKFDFVDLIEQYIVQCDAPYSDMVIVDEAQDLNYLQWKMVAKLFAASTEGYIAGDDDQAIYRFAGAEVSEFISISQNKIVLDQSYRLPRKVWELANQLSKRIKVREPKVFKPREEIGDVQYHLSWDTLPLDKDHSFTIMTRVNSFMYNFASKLEDEGFVFSIKGRSSIDETKAQVVRLWERLQEGEELRLGEVVLLYKNAAKRGDRAAVKHGASKLLEAADPEQFYGYDLLVSDYGLTAPISTSPLDIAQMSEREKLYYDAIKRRGVDPLQPPRIKLSTFHTMKGGEDEHCVVYLGTTKACAENDPDDEHRAFYVAITRARDTLHVLETDKRYRYEL
jgi:DNA helicase-2/ATP-dependent DNA helicase PcrA